MSISNGLMSSEPFAIEIPAGVLDDLRDRLLKARFPVRTPGDPWAAGTEPDYLRTLTTYWANTFDWREQERRLNLLPQYRARIGGQAVHFVHARGRGVAGGPAPLPLVLTHGWPSSFAEFGELIPLLTDPAAHGGDATDAFDVVVPSLPGHLFSDLPADGPLTRPRIADLWARLMTEALGYPRFGAYGGDIGADVTNWLAIQHAERVVGIHLIHPKLPTSVDGARPLSAAEQAYLDRRAVEDEQDGGYSAIMATRPDTIAAALMDSPSGLAAWIVDKWRAWSDCHGDLESRFRRDDLLTLITLYWVTDSIGTSFRTYYDYPANPPRPMIGVPTGVTLTIEDIGYPRELAERSYEDIRHWRDPTVGGHFFPQEEPELLARELRAFFRPLRAV
jgi:pimeloyl-ACP methyl ester carboxylesterase